MEVGSADVTTPSTQLRASAYKYGPSNGTSREIDFAPFLPIDWL